MRQTSCIIATPPNKATNLLAAAMCLYQAIAAGSPSGQPQVQLELVVEQEHNNTDYHPLLIIQPLIHTLPAKSKVCHYLLETSQ